MRADRFGKLLVILFVVGWAGSVLASSGKDDSSVDWSVMIARLRQELLQRPGQASVRRQLAVAYNNYGVSLSNQKQWESAVQQLQEAIRIDAANEQFRSNLSRLYLNQAYEAYQHHEINDALQTIDQAIALTPNLAAAYRFRGEIEYGRQNLKEARSAWQRALELDPSQSDLKQRLGQVMQELPVESKFEKLSQAYFDLRYEEHLQQPVGFDVRDLLLEARREVGADFAHWPKYKIVVLIYSAESFRALRRETPDWVAGQYDGKIRVPLPDTKLGLGTVKQILYHEYTHALVHDLTKGKCPIWLNEGLAEYEGNRDAQGSWLYVTQAAQAGRLVPWTELSDHFSTVLPMDEVALAYQESHSMIRYLVQRYGFWRLRRLLRALGEGTPSETALADEFHIKPSRLEADWRSWLSQP